MLEMLPELPLLSELEQLMEAIRDSPDLVDRKTRIVGQVYCPRCMRFARTAVTMVGRERSVDLNLLDDIPSQITPSAWLYSCLQCLAKFSALVFEGPAGPELVVFADVPGGLTTPNTPEPVAYYLDQASRAEAAGANSAAVVMYRAALEHLLFGFGYTDGTCGTKISDLEKDLAGNAPGAPRWGRDLTPDDLRLLKNLGDGAAHPNDGDVARQRVLDKQLLIALSVTFAALLDAAYERPKAEEARKRKLAEAVAALGKPAK